MCRWRYSVHHVQMFYRQNNIGVHGPCPICMCSRFLATDYEQWVIITTIYKTNHIGSDSSDRLRYRYRTRRRLRCNRPRKTCVVESAAGHTAKHAYRRRCTPRRVKSRVSPNTFTARPSNRLNLVLFFLSSVGFYVHVYAR